MLGDGVENTYPLSYVFNLLISTVKRKKLNYKKIFEQRGYTSGRGTTGHAVGVGIEYRSGYMIFFVEHSPVVSLCAKKTELYNTTNEK